MVSDKIHPKRHIQYKIPVLHAVFHGAASAFGCLSDIGQTVAVFLPVLRGNRQTVCGGQLSVKAVAYTEQEQILADSSCPSVPI